MERLVRLQRIGGFLLVAGAGVAIAAVAALLANGVPARLGRLGAMQNFDAATLVAFLALGVGALVAVAGLALYVVVPGLDPALARRDFDSPRTLATALAAVFVLGNLIPLPVFYLSGVRDASLPLPVLVAAMLGTQVALMSVLMWRVVRPGAITWEAMGLTTEHLNRRILQGLVGGFAIFALAGAIGVLMRAFGVQQTQTEQFAVVRGVGPSQFLGFWLMAAVVAPICEECFFRGYVFTALRGRLGRPAAYIGSALLFAAIHLNLPALLPILVMALGLAFLYERSRSVVPGIVAHGLNNGVALALLYGGVAT